MKMGQQSLAAFFFCCSLGTDVGVWEKHLSGACDRSSYALVPCAAWPAATEKLCSKLTEHSSWLRMRNRMMSALKHPYSSRTNSQSVNILYGFCACPS